MWPGDEAAVPDAPGLDKLRIGGDLLALSDGNVIHEC